MKTSHKFYSIALIFLILAGCKDLIEEDVTGSKINIISPADKYISSSYNVTFWWDEVDGAQKYRLQIVSPRFDSLERILIDTPVTDTKIVLSLFPGKYQWRLRVENGNSHSSYIMRSIEIDTNINFTGQNFPVDYPLDNYVTNKTIIAFSWQPFPLAVSYEYMLSDSNNVPVKTIKTTQTSYIDTFADGRYIWRVRAINTINNTTTLYSSPRSVLIDHITPTEPGNIAPLDFTFLDNPVILSWQHTDNAYADSIIVSTDSNFTTAISRYYTEGTSFTLPTLLLGSTYFWKVRSKDRAGNLSGYTPFHRFTINP